MLNIVIPMAGAGSRFKKQGFDLPKPFIDIKGKMMIERVLDGLKINNATYTLIIQEQFKEENKTQLNLISQNYNVKFIAVKKLTLGAACTALSSHENINNKDSVIFADSDNIFKHNVISNFIKNIEKLKLDGGLITFNTNKESFSFVEIDKNGIAVRTKEKEAISNNAIAGVYMFSRGSDFVKSVIEMMIYGDVTKGEYYMSNVYNYAIANGLKIGIHEISEYEWSCVGTPEQLTEYLDNQ